MVCEGTNDDAMRTPQRLFQQAVNLGRDHDVYLFNYLHTPLRFPVTLCVQGTQVLQQVNGQVSSKLRSNSKQIGEARGVNSLRACK